MRTKTSNRQLPDVNIFPLFDEAYFKVGTNGKVQPLDASPVLPKPASPTNGIVNDDDDTYAVTPPTGYETSQLETSSNSGATYANNNNLHDPFYIGNANKDIGEVITRVKSVPDVNQAGFGLANDVPFTASGSGDVWIPISGTVSPNWFDQTGDITVTGNDLVAGSEGNQRIRTLVKLPAGGVGKLRCSFLQGSTLAVSTNGTDLQGDNEMAYFGTQNPVNNKVKFRDNITGLFDQETADLGSPQPIELEFTGTEVIFKYGTGNTELGRSTQTNSDMWVKATMGALGLISDVEVTGDFE